MAPKKRVEKLPNDIMHLFEVIAGNAGGFVGRMTFNALSEADKERAEAIVDFKKRAYDRAVELGPAVWENWDFVKETFFWSPVEPSLPVLAALVYPSARTWAIGRKIIQRAPKYKLLVSFRAMTLTPEKLDAVLKHELLHIGFSGHGPDFRKVCREVGGVVGADAVDGKAGTWFEQRQPNGRYKQASPTFESEPLAMSWYHDAAQREARRAQAVAWLAANPGKGPVDAQKALMWRVVHA